MPTQDAKQHLLSKLQGADGLEVATQDPAPDDGAPESIFNVLMVPHEEIFYLWVRPRSLLDDAYPEERGWTRIEVALEDRALDRAAERALHRDLAGVLMEQADVPTEVDHQTDLCTRLWSSSFGLGDEVQTLVSIPWHGQTLRAYVHASAEELDAKTEAPWVELVADALSR